MTHFKFWLKCILIYSLLDQTAVFHNPACETYGALVCIQFISPERKRPLYIPFFFSLYLPHNLAECPTTWQIDTGSLNSPTEAINFLPLQLFIPLLFQWHALNMINSPLPSVTSSVTSQWYMERAHEKDSLQTPQAFFFF